MHVNTFTSFVVIALAGFVGSINAYKFAVFFDVILAKPLLKDSLACYVKIYGVGAVGSDGTRYQGLSFNLSHKHIPIIINVDSEIIPANEQEIDDLLSSSNEHHYDYTHDYCKDLAEYEVPSASEAGVSVTDIEKRLWPLVRFKVRRGVG